jgi:hypothetical protein
MLWKKVSRLKALMITMKLKFFVAMGLVGAIATSTPAKAQPTPMTSPGVKIAAMPQAFNGFSGQSANYADSSNGFKINIPAEFKLVDKGMTTNWIGPLMDGGATLISINAAPLKGVPSKTVYEMNLKSKKSDRTVTDVAPVTVKMGGKTAYALRWKESSKKPGTADTKAPTDIHRWHLLVFGNETVYTLGFTGPFASFQSNKLQATYEQVIKSVELIPVSGH